MRSFFFGRQDKPEEKTFIIIDGISAGVNKEFADTSYFLRHKFLATYKFCQELEDLTFEDFSNKRKELIKMMQEYIKFFAVHIKSGHKEIYDNKMNAVLKPLRDFIDINYSYRSFNHNWIQEPEKEVRDFKLKAVIDKYILYFQEVLRVLHDRSKEAPKVVCSPDIRKFFYKISLKGWKDRPVEELYMRPLHINFKRMQKHLWKMWYDGINYWKIPLAANTELVDMINDLIKSELIAERLIGNPLKRDQLNFLFNIIKLIKDSNSMVC